MMLADGEPSGPENIVWQMIAAITALSGAVVFMFKALLTGKDQHITSLENKVNALDIKLVECEKKHDASEHEMRQMWYVIGKKFDATPDELKKQANDSGKVL